MLILLTLAAAAGSPPPDQRLLQMTALYERVCLRAFPDDKAVETLMAKLDARELTPDEVKVTMVNDPARGWDVIWDGSASVWLEFPPFHACSVRWNAPTLGVLDQYRSIAEKYEASIGGFQPIDPLDGDQGDIHIHAIGERRILPDKTSESLFVFDQYITDLKRRAASETGFVLRLVHQFAPPPPNMR